MATRYILTPGSAEMPSANFPELLVVNSTERRQVLAFDAAADEQCAWSTKAVQGLTGALTAVVTYSMASATTGTVVFEVYVEADTVETDSLNVHTSDGYAATNASAADTVPGTAGIRGTVSITLTNNDSIAAGDSVRFRLRRDADSSNATDDAAGDAYVHSLEIRDAA